jgi:hypothetical protein
MWLYFECRCWHALMVCQALFSSAICLFFAASVESRDFYSVCASVPTTEPESLAPADPGQGRLACLQFCDPAPGLGSMMASQTFIAQAMFRFTRSRH